MFLDGSSSKEWLRYKFKNKQAKNISLVPWCLKKKNPVSKKNIWYFSYPVPMIHPRFIWSPYSNNQS